MDAFIGKCLTRGSEWPAQHFAQVRTATRLYVILEEYALAEIATSSELNCFWEWCTAASNKLGQIILQRFGESPRHVCGCY